MNSIDKQTSGSEKGSIDIIGPAEIARILRRHLLLILALILVCTVASAIYTWRQPRRYEAMCRVDVNLSAPSSSIAVGVGGDQVSSVTEKEMATQLGIISSQAIAWDVIKKLRLDKKAEFKGSFDTSRLSDLDSMPDVYKFSLIRQFQGNLAVQYERGTEIAQIRYRSADRALAALVANTIADSYIERNFQTKYKTTQKTSTWLDGQLQSLRNQVSDAEREFADFQSKTGLLETAEGRSTLLDSVNALNTALSAAQAQRILKEVSYRESLNSDPDQVLPSGSLPTLTSMRLQKETLEEQYSALSAKFGQAYPRLIQLKSEIAGVDRSIQSQIGRGRDQLAAEYKAALANENKLNAAVEAQKQQIFAMNENALRYSILQRQVGAKRDLYEDLTRKLQEAQIASGLSSDAIAVIDTALAPNIPAEPRRALNLEVGFLIGVVLGVALAFLLENVNATVRTVSDVTLHSNLPIISLIPHAESGKTDRSSEGPENTAPGRSPLIITADATTRFADAFRSLRSTLLLSSAGAPPKFIAVCSAWPKEGKSTTTINLAISLAQAGKKVLLVDADLKRPTVHLKLGLSPARVGLSGLLTSPELATRDHVYHEVVAPTLDFLPAGQIPPSSAELLMSNKMTALIEEWREEYDFVVIDTAPVLAISDTSALIPLMDSVVLVVRVGATRRKSLKAARDLIVALRGKITGIALNDVKSTSEVYYGYYGGKGSYGSYYTEGEDA